MSMLDELKKTFDRMRNEDMRAAMIKEQETTKAAKAAKEVGMARGAMNNLPLVQEARRVAREMMANGPVTIEDVCDRMAAEGRPVWAGSKDAPKNWKGSVFNDPCFVCVGSIPSRKESNHGRHVRQWALKSWLREHPMNGESSSVSAFSFIRIYNQVMHDHAGIDPGHMLWVIGRDALPEGMVMNMLSADGKSQTLYGIRVCLVDGVGAVLQRNVEWPPER